MLYKTLKLVRFWGSGPNQSALQFQRIKLQHITENRQTIGAGAISGFKYQYGSNNQSDNCEIEVNRQIQARSKSLKSAQLKEYIHNIKLENMKPSELLRYQEDTYDNFGVLLNRSRRQVGRQRDNLSYGVAHGAILILFILVEQYYKYSGDGTIQSPEYYTQVLKDLVIRLALVFIGITNYQAFPYKGFCDWLFFALVYVYGGTENVIYYGFWIASGLSPVYAIYKLFCIIGFLITISIVNIFNILLIFLITFVVLLFTTYFNITIGILVSTLLHILFTSIYHYYYRGDQIRLLRRLFTVLAYKEVMLTIICKIYGMYFLHIHSRFVGSKDDFNASNKKHVFALVRTYDTKYMGQPLWSMPDCNLPGAEQYNYCTTIALGYMLQVIPQTFDESIGNNTIKSKLSEIVNSYEAFAQITYQKIRDFPFVSAKLNGKCYSTDLINKCGVNEQNNRLFWTQKQRKVQGLIRSIIRFDIRDDPQEVLIVNEFLCQMGINMQYLTGKNHIKPDSHILIYKSHAYINPTAFYNFIDAQKQQQVPKPIKEPKYKDIPKQVPKTVKEPKYKDIPKNKPESSFGSWSRNRFESFASSKLNQSGQNSSQNQSKTDKSINTSSASSKQNQTLIQSGQNNSLNKSKIEKSTNDQDKSYDLDLDSSIQSEKELTFEDTMTQYHALNSYVVFSNTVQVYKSAIIGQQGHIIRTKNGCQLQTDKLCLNFNCVEYPIDYTDNDYPVVNKVQVCFNAWIVILEDGLQPNRTPIQTHIFRSLFYDKVVDMQVMERLKMLMTGLTLSVDNMMVVKMRYLEYFNEHSSVKHKLSVCNDLYGEFDQLVSDSLQFVFTKLREQIRVQQNELSQKREWWKIVMRSEFYDTFKLYAPKDEEFLSEYIHRLAIPDNLPKWVFIMGFNFFFDEEQIVQTFIKILSNIKKVNNFDYMGHVRGIVYRQDLGLEPKFDGNSGFSFLDDSRDVGEVGANGDYTYNEYYHKTDPNSYDILKTNPKILKEITFYHPITKENLGELSGQQIMDIYGPLCTCKKNGAKRRVTEQTPNIDEQLCFATYSSCPLNAIGAIVQRQAATFLLPDPSFVQRFKNWYSKQSVPGQFIKEFYRLDHTQYTFDKYLDKISEVDKKKADRYKKGRLAAMISGAINFLMGCFPKTGEWFVKRRDTDIKNYNNRSRNICNPSDELLGVCNHINYIGLALLKKVCPEYTSYLNNDELQDRVYSAWQEISRYGEPCAISTDFSSHDSNQHPEFLETVDNNIWNTLLPHIYDKLQLPSSLYKQTLQGLTKLDTNLKYKMMIRKKMRKIFKAKIQGTVTSGHPTRTTFGNTLRVIMYYKFLFQELKIKHFKMFVGGDDFYCILTKTDAETLKNNIGLYFSKTQQGMLGLGQCVRKVNILGNKVDFLSKIGVIHPSKCFIFRQFPRIAYLQQYSASPVKDLEALVKALTCSLFCSGYDFTFVKKMCKNLGDLQQNMSLAKQYSFISQFLNISMATMLHRSSVIISTQLYQGADVDLIDVSSQFGDMSELDKYQIIGQINDAMDNRFDWLKQNTYKPVVAGGGMNIIARRTNLNEVQIGSSCFSQSLINSQVQNIQSITKATQIKNPNQGGKSEPSSINKTVVKEPGSKIPQQIIELQHIRAKNFIGSRKKKNNVPQISKDKVQSLNALQKEISDLRVNRRQKTSEQQRVKRAMKNNISQQKKDKVTYQQQFSMKNMDYDKYKRMVLSPFNSQAVRAPSSFFQPTSLLTYRLEFDFTPGTGHGAIVVNPHCFSQQQISNGFSWFNANKDINPGVTGQYSYGASTVTFPNQVYVHPLAGGGSVNDNPQDLSSSNFTDGTKRWTTARTLATGIRLYSTGQQVNKSGTITLGILPGSQAEKGSPAIAVPSPQSLRQYPTSYEIAQGQIGITGTDLIYLPLDPLDNVFIHGSSNINSDEIAANAYYRNQMWILFNGLAISDSFRIEVVCHVEYIPTLPFGSWSPPLAPKLDDSHLSHFLKEVRTQLPSVINGDLGRKIAGALEIGKKIGQGVQLVSSLL